MSEPIKNKKIDQLATAPRTPQNTPASNTALASRAQQPGVASIQEEELDHAAVAASLFSQNPKIVSMIQGKLGTLIGQSSGYIETLPLAVRRRIAGLKGIQGEHSKIEVQLQKEFLELEKKYFAKFLPLYEKRAKIVNGIEEPSEEEIKSSEEKQEGKPEGSSLNLSNTDDVHEENNKISGIPEFWLSAMKNQISLAEMITDRDEAALRHLTDIRMEYFDKPGFKLIFQFAENDFFTNKSISKTYYYQEESGYGGDFIYDHAEGDVVNWKAGQDLTMKVESKKQRNKNTKQTRIVKKSVPIESFFNFFSPPTPPKDEDSAAPDIEERLELDYQLGEDIKEKLIPRAVDWFTGEALQYEQIEDEFENEELDDDDDEDEDDDDLSEDQDDDDESEDAESSSKPKQDAAECKQS